ncbi:TetR/AcrR family transcriptional regulator [Phytoactinopolyspora mesophila]|uniref:TetR family transcriptional regulator n=1 Tax=Phytoactinopolyspora mesophila TaxID=2650750 RepID=A0A7K3M7V6_9ACTN|nr:TetR/AcrR family transcriptional regulator [Phytoactinopolyspora mesophila]NDL59137.1 TetR family transcriptional regulator [Phytoactinopolyspora mesophila]
MSKGADTRRIILRRGVQTAYQVGLGGLTIGNLASSTGMSKSGLFAHFQSKEALQLAVLAESRAEFIDSVIRPALAAPRGEPRVRELFDRWLDCGLFRMPGGCLFVKAATELDEQPGPVRDQLVQDHRDLLDTIAQVFRTGITEGQFREDADAEQFAHDLNGVMLGFYHAHRLLDDTAAQPRARRAFEALLDAARAPDRATPPHSASD